MKVKTTKRYYTIILNFSNYDNDILLRDNSTTIIITGEM